MSSAPGLAGLEPSRIENAALDDAGERVLAWTRTNMPLLAGLRSAFERERPLEGRRIGMCLQRALAVDPTAFAHGYNPVPPEIDRVVAEEALATLSTVERER